VTFDLGIVMKLLPPVAGLGSAALNIYLFLRARSDKRFDEYDQSLAQYDQGQADIDRRLVKLETEFEGAPNHEDLKRIEDALGELGEGLATVKERSMNQLHSLRRIEDHLLERSK
jgi:hypothetical protein